MDPYERPPSLYPHEIEIQPEHETRLVDLLPGSGNAKIVCTTAAYLLNDEPRINLSPPTAYDALSYVWGKWDTLAYIQLNDIPDFPVTRNLFNALRRLRLKNDSRRLWIDQLSINQQSDDERKRQVQQMGRIFGQAWRVIVWLGDTNDPQDFYPPSVDETARAALASVIKSDLVDPWWTRAWVVEEYALARELPMVLFGPYMIQWEEMLRFANRSSRLPNDSYAKMHHQLDRFRVLRPRKDGSRSQVNLHSLSVVLKDTSTLDPRDKIWCILPSLPESQRELMDTRRKSTVVEVFAQATYACLRTTGNIGILSLVTRLSCPDKKHDLPSWGVDFTFPDKKHTVRALHFAEGSRFEKYQDKLFDMLAKSNLEMLWNTFDFGSNPKSWTRKHPRSTAQIGEPGANPLLLKLTALELDTVQDMADVDSSLGLKDLATPGNSLIQPYMRMAGLTAASKAVRWIDHQSFNTQEREVIASVDTRLAHCNPYLLLDAAESQKLKHPLLTHSVRPKRVRMNMLDAMWRHWDAAARPPEAGAVDEISIPFVLKDLKERFASETGNGLYPGWGGPGSMTNNVFFRLLSMLDSRGISFFATAAGFIGTGPVDLRNNDRIILPYGSRLPVVLRSTRSGNWIFVGFCYVRGLMDGELWDHFQDIELEEKEYTLE